MTIHIPIAGTELQPKLRRLIELGVMPDALRGQADGPEWTVTTSGEGKPFTSLVEAAAAVRAPLGSWIQVATVCPACSRATMTAKTGTPLKP